MSKDKEEVEEDEDEEYDSELDVEEEDEDEEYDSELDVEEEYGCEYCGDLGCAGECEEDNSYIDEEDETCEGCGEYFDDCICEDEKDTQLTQEAPMTNFASTVNSIYPNRCVLCGNANCRGECILALPNPSTQANAMPTNAINVSNTSEEAKAKPKEEDDEGVCDVCGKAECYGECVD